MAEAMKQFHPTLKRGDAFLHNSPYHGNSHAADHTILVPVVDDECVHRFTVLTKAHQADCGNALPTTYMGAAVDVYAEGALIFPAVKVQEDYKDIDDIVRMCEVRIRVPGQWKGDFLAMVGSARIGEREVLALGREVDGPSSKHSPDSGSISARSAWPRASGRSRRAAPLQRARMMRSQARQAEESASSLPWHHIPNRAVSPWICATTSMHCLAA
jgi:N-methylhydantoinase B/oxoprolinase/acetone carboxylase alpha subunit